MSSSILVTGGAGYIGSHVLRQLRERGERVVVLDNLSTGYRSAVLGAPLVVGDTGDRELVARLLNEHAVDTVLHFAAHTIVPESVSNPLKYYGNNTCATRSLLEQCDRAGVKHFVFSSTAAVYGTPEGGLAREDSPTAPINPYGLSKLMSEWMLRRQRPRRTDRADGAQRDAAREGRMPASGGRATAAVDFRHRLPDAGRHGCARLHPRRRPCRCASEGGGLPAVGRCVDDVELRLRARVQRA
jgi:hypothetical protein